MDPGGHVGKFAQKVCSLAAMITKAYPNDAEMYRAYRRITALAQINPNLIIGTVGPYLYKYREQILAMEGGGENAREFFLDSEYKDDLRAGTDQEKVDMVVTMMPRLKNFVRALPQGGKEECSEFVIGLLDVYLEHLGAMQGI
jgi:hypothetical protein